MNRLCLKLACAIVFVLSAAAPTGAQDAMLPTLFGSLDLTERDLELLKAAEAELQSESLEIGTVKEWSSEDSDLTGSVKLARKFEHNGMPCVGLIYDFVLPNDRDPNRRALRWCKTDDGVWKILS